MSSNVPNAGVSAPEVPASPFRAIQRQPVFFVIPIIIGLVIGLMLGESRTPIYTAQAQLLVGSIDTSAQSVPGIVAANQSLAATYARLIGTPAITSIVRDTEAKGKYHNVGTVSASPIPESPIVLVTATGTNSTQVLGLATDTTAALRTYIQTLNSGSDNSGVLAAYSAAASDLATATRNRDTVKANSRSSSADIDAAQAAVDTAQLRVTALGAQYQSQETGQQSGAADAQIISQATLAGSDKHKKLELMAAVGLIAGVLVGMALATFVSSRRPNTPQTQSPTSPPALAS